MVWEVCPRSFCIIALKFDRCWMQDGPTGSRPCMQMTCLSGSPLPHVKTLPTGRPFLDSAVPLSLAAGLCVWDVLLANEVPIFPF
jgi:hypothetical protein